MLPGEQNVQYGARTVFARYPGASGAFEPLQAPGAPYAPG